MKSALQFFHMFFAAGCEEPWKYSTNVCYLLFHNVQASWIAAYAFCLKQGGLLANTQDLLRIGNNSLSNVITPKRCWLAERKVYAPRDALEGWHWLNGSLLRHVDDTWAVGELSYNGKRGRCAALANNQIWVDEHCNNMNRYICKIEKTVKKQGPENKVNETTVYLVSDTKHLHLNLVKRAICFVDVTDHLNAEKLNDRSILLNLTNHRL